MGTEMSYQPRRGYQKVSLSETARLWSEGYGRASRSVPLRGTGHDLPIPLCCVRSRSLAWGYQIVSLSEAISSDSNDRSENNGL